MAIVQITKDLIVFKHTWLQHPETIGEVVWLVTSTFKLLPRDRTCVKLASSALFWHENVLCLDKRSHSNIGEVLWRNVKVKQIQYFT